MNQNIKKNIIYLVIIILLIILFFHKNEKFMSYIYSPYLYDYPIYDNRYIYPYYYDIFYPPFYTNWYIDSDPYYRPRNYTYDYRYKFNKHRNLNHRDIKRKH